MKARRLSILIGLTGAAFLLLVGPATANSPWWHLTSGSRPTNLKAGAAQSEIQEIDVTPAEGAAAFELNVGGSELGIFVYPEAFANEIGFPAMTAANLQAALEGPYGAGNVSVTEAENPDGSVSFSIESVNGAAYQSEPPVIVTPLLGDASARVIQEGRADGQIILTAANLGTAAIDGEAAPVQIVDTLPPGLEATSISAEAGEGSLGVSVGHPGVVSCVNSSLTCSFAEPLPPFEQIEVRIGVKVKEGAQSGELNQASVSGGVAPPAQISRPIAISGDPTPFGVEDYELANEEAGGGAATQAGSHPFQQTTTIVLNQGPPGRSPEGSYTANPVALAKDLHFHWPAGLLGNPTPFARCSLAQFLTQVEDAPQAGVNACPPESAVGVAMVTINEPINVNVATFAVPVFNLEPAFGEPARLGFLYYGVPVLIDPSLRQGPGGDYGITVTTANISQTAAVLSSEVTVWGVPGEPRHDASRGWGCLEQARGEEHLPCPAGTAHPPAFLTLPTACSGAPLQTSLEADSWLEPSEALTFPGAPMPALDSCNQLPFDPQLSSEPTSNAATSPTGLNVDLNVEDEGLINAEGTAQSQIKKAVVTLPEGFTTNPSVAEGLKACSLAQYEATTVEPGSGCPQESKIGDLEIESPLVTQKISGALYVAKQGDNPFGNLLTLYLVARNPEIGVVIKSAAEVRPDPVTGQLVTTVDEIPQLPFSHFHLAFRQGQRSPLITPPACGTYTVEADLYPRSEPETPRHRESSFQITEGPEGEPCPSGGTPPFHPNLIAGSENPTAGAYSPFYVRMTRRDSEQEITHFSIKLPPGVLGKLAGVAQCSDAGIAAAKAREHEGGGGEEEASPSCPAASQIGRTNVGTGVGNVLAYAPGKLYLAGPYHGSAISIVSITAAKVGPFDLGTVVVREALRVNPETAEVFVDATGSDPIPHIVDGIPIHLRDVQAFVDRPDFTLNPTSCEKTSTASTVLGAGLDFASAADDVPVTVTSPFQVGSCASLGFKPKLKLRLLGATKRGGHPKLRAELTMRSGEANIAYSQVTLPHAAFLDQSHINTVCTRVQFKAGAGNGAECPAGSIYGYARAITPILDQPLEGPVYLRSSEHKLPDLVAALHNGEINIDLVGRIDSVNGRIRNTFEAVPDAPVTKFTLEMQGGKKGLLVNSTNLCQGRHRAIVDFTGHNGKISDTTPAVGARCRKGHKRHRHAHRGHRR